MDGMLWFDDSVDLADGSPADWTRLAYEEYFHCVDLGVQLKPVIERYARWRRDRAPPLRVASPPLAPDALVKCDPPTNFDRDELAIVRRGDEVLSTIHTGPADLASSASPFDLFAWQRRGVSRCRIDDGPPLTFEPGDVALLRKGSKYDWHLEPDATLLSVGNVYT
mmetsp:Transcript_21981/g.68799  ORF Transcript_21981/g.68799 Transcript_21981/m.68799 type:complete len:166 (+) Transcript_21981:472-969(+)